MCGLLRLCGAVEDSQGQRKKKKKKKKKKKTSKVM
jgi:hypothetical protein